MQTADDLNLRWLLICLSRLHETAKLSLGHLRLKKPYPEKNFLQQGKKIWNDLNKIQRSAILHYSIILCCDVNKYILKCSWYETLCITFQT